MSHDYESNISRDRTMVDCAMDAGGCGDLKSLSIWVAVLSKQPPTHLSADT
jgi:hypothetical protein